MEFCFNSRLRLQKDTQCTYNLTLGCVQVTSVAVENQSVLQIPIEFFTLTHPTQLQPRGNGFFDLLVIVEPPASKEGFKMHERMRITWR